MNAGTPPSDQSAWNTWRPMLLPLWIGLLAACFAIVEIQIEGAAGWAANLPTWRVESHPLLALFWGGRPMTGYHAWIFSFMALVFHLPLFLSAHPAWKLEARIIGCLMIFWIVEDALWFIFNPAFGLARLTPETVWWHKHWTLGLPTDYLTFTAMGVALLAWSFRSQRRHLSVAPAPASATGSVSKLNPAETRP